jgi:hypothetical protein
MQVKVDVYFVREKENSVRGTRIRLCRAFVHFMFRFAPSANILSFYRGFPCSNVEILIPQQFARTVRWELASLFTATSAH